MTGRSDPSVDGDAARTLANEHVREQVGLETLQAELRGVVAETMQPAHVPVWLPRAAPR